LNIELSGLNWNVFQNQFESAQLFVFSNIFKIKVDRRSSIVFFTIE